MNDTTMQRMFVRMDGFPGALTALLVGVSADDARFRPESGAWSIIEVVNHLVDEESEDFRRRVRMTLDDPHQVWPSIDPEGVAVSRKYIERELTESLERFAAARAASVVWLRTLTDPDWTLTYRHPSIGELRAGDVMVSWCAHDALHLRQIAKRMFELTQRDGEGFKTDYAGDW
jgi:hypothetical protein